MESKVDVKGRGVENAASAGWHIASVNTQARLAPLDADGRGLPSSSRDLNGQTVNSTPLDCLVYSLSGSEFRSENY